MRQFTRLLVTAAMVVGVSAQAASAARQTWLPAAPQKPKTTPPVVVHPTIPNPILPPAPNPTPGPWPPVPNPWPPVPWPPAPRPYPWPDPIPPIRDFDYDVYYVPSNIFGATMRVYGRYETLAEARYVANQLQAIGYLTRIDRVRDFGGRLRQ